MKSIFTSFLLLLCFQLSAQVIADFEIFDIEQDSFRNGSDLNGGFASGNVFLPNDFNTQFGSWSGWAISADTDTLTPGFMNQYSAITGQGFDGSDNYGVAFMFNPDVLELRNDAVGEEVAGMYITNNTYAYLEIRDGGFGKKFGGVTGDDPDFFLLTIRAYFNGSLSTDSVNFYLADYRFSDNSQDYIIDEWTWVDLSSLGRADSLHFSLSSTDNSPMFGMNTPAYFCVDNITTAGLPVSTHSPALADALTLYPNPASETLWLDWQNDQNVRAELYNLAGQMMLADQIVRGQQQLDIRSLSSGMYILRLVDAAGNWANRKLVIR